MERIRININRQRAFSGCLVRENVFVGGKRSPDLKNGKSAGMSVKSERVIFVQYPGVIRNNAVIFTSGEEEIGLRVRFCHNIGNGYKTVFLPEGSDVPFYSVSFDRLFEGLDGGRPMNDAQRKLALLAFVSEADDTEEILRSKHAGEVVGALKELGASLYASSLERVIAALFPDRPLPIEGGEEDEDMAEKFRKAEETIMDADENGRLTEELARAAANHISAHFDELFTAEDLYCYDGSFDRRRGAAEKPSVKHSAPKRRLGKKQIMELALAAVIFLVVACGLLFFWRNGVYYPVRAALPDNSHTVTVEPLQIRRQSAAEWPGGSSYINIYCADGESYSVDWGNVPNNGMSAEEFISALEKERSLTLVVRDGNTVCAVSGEEAVYISVEDFNRYQKKQSTMGSVLVSVMSLFAALGFAGAAFVIKHSDR